VKWTVFRHGILAKAAQGLYRYETQIVDKSTDSYVTPGVNRALWMLEAVRALDMPMIKGTGMATPLVYRGPIAITAYGRQLLAAWDVQQPGLANLRKRTAELDQPTQLG